MEQARQALKKLNVFAQMGRDSPSIARRRCVARLLWKTGSSVFQPSLKLRRTGTETRRSLRRRRVADDDSSDSFSKQRCSQPWLHDLAAYFARGLLRTLRLLKSEGAGNAGRPMRPIAACAMKVVERTRVSQVTPESPGIPRAMVYGLFRALPGDRAFLPPSPAELLPLT